MRAFFKLVAAIGAVAFLTANSFVPVRAQSLAVASAESAGHKAIDDINKFMATHKCRSQADAGTISSLALEAEDTATMLRTLYTHEGLGPGKSLSKRDSDTVTDLALEADSAARRIRDLPPCPPQTASSLTGPRTSSPYSFALTTGPTFSFYSSSYRSTGAQAPRDSSSTATTASLCGGVSGYWPMESMVYQGTYGGGINLCGNFGGGSTLFAPVIHPLGGVVRASVTPGVRIEAFVGVHWDAFGPERSNPFVFMRVGPVIAENKLSISSNQTGAGGLLETADRVNWTVGGMLEAGLSSPLCNDCLGGRAVRWSISAKYYWLPGTQSVSVRSTAFGFVEEASIRSESDLSIHAGLSTQF